VKTIIRMFAAAVRKVPWLIVAATIGLTALFGSLAGQAEIAQGNEGFAPDNREIQASERIGELFGAESQESIVQIVIRGDDVLGADGLGTVNAVTESIMASEAADELSERPDRPAIVSFMGPVFQGSAAQNIDPTVLDDAGVDQIFARAMASPAMAESRSFIASLLAEGADIEDADAPGGLMLVFLQQPEGADGDETFNALIDLEGTVADAALSADIPDGIEVRPFSFALLFEDQDEFTSEVGRLFAMAAVIILVILGYVFWLRPGASGSRLGSIRRTVADVGVTLVTILAAISWMQGIGVLLEKAGIIGSFNPVTQIIPILLIGLGVDYGIHLISRYREELGTGLDVPESVSRAIGTVGIALTLATMTTAIGFLTNVFNPVPALKDFGILASIGIVVSFVLMLTFVPAVRLLADRRAEAAGRIPREGMEANADRLLPRIIERASILAERVPVPTLIVALVLGGMGVWGLTQLDVRFSITDFLPEDAPAVETLQILEDEFGGGLGESTQILIESESDLATPEVHNALVGLMNDLPTIADVVKTETPDGAVASAQSVISLIQAFYRQGPESVPPPLAEAAEAAGMRPDFTVEGDVGRLWSTAADLAPELAASSVHSDDGTVDALLVDVQTQAGEGRAAELAAALEAALDPLQAMEGVTAIPTSQNIISAVIVNELADSQTNSLLMTLVVATIVLAISFWFENRRPFLGVLTMLPVGLVVFWTYGLMYVTGIPFGPVTATLAALAVGIGVPFTIHIARRFEEDRVRFDTLEDALRSTTRHTGGALAGSAFTTMAGFGILVTSSLKPFQQMGLVTVYAIGLALVAAVLVLPSLLALWERWHRRRGDAIVDKETVSVI